MLEDYAMNRDIKHVSQNGLDGKVEGTPLCPKCLSPIEPANYYCPHCGEATGQLTPYIPFVNIRFNYSIFSRLWRKVWYERTGLLMKAFSLFLIIWCVPIMLIGLPFVLRDKLKGAPRKKEPDLKQSDQS